MKIITRMSVLGAVALSLLAFAAIGAGAQEGARLSVVVPAEEPDKGDTFEVQIFADNVTNLGGFQFALRFDNDVLTATEVARTDFLGASGRDVVCDDAVITGPTVSLICVTAGGADLPGREGSGPLAIVTFEATGTGDSDLELTGQLSRIDGISLPALVESGEITVSEPRDWTPIIVIAAVAAAILLLALAGAAYLLRRRSRPAQPDWAPPTESSTASDDPGV